ncbi:MAG: glycosyltransferase family 2 protein [Ruminococcus sp.]|jgi:dolichol-phosphate mannosyltransferase|nr:glycosyltransferase family 2 protein [Ruminococcus sp.]MBO5558496.1 glycosyltransferase family 2 protein [Ruminococcus sp.]MBR0529230.1 glycosyltransferase family 2 protein [Ruminococcus sp.]
MKNLISVIIPAYNEEGNVERTASAVGRILSENDIDYEIVFINDGSADRTWQKMQAMANSDKRITAVNFSRNFGKESAIFAGLELARGDCAVLFDCDLQFPVETVVEMYRIWEKGGVDIVEGRKKSRGKENPVYKGFSLLFYKLIGKGSGLDMQDASDFKLMDRCVIDALNRMPERLTFFRAMSGWVGFSTEKVWFEVAEREIGTSKWKPSQLVHFAVNNITSFTSAPLQIVTAFGVITFLISIILGVNTLYNKFFGNSEAGFPTVIILQLLTSSIIMFSLGVIGYYISKIYEEIKQRPRYIIRDIVRQREDKDKNG